MRGSQRRSGTAIARRAPRRHARGGGRSTTEEAVLELQGQVGNAAVTALLARPTVAVQRCPGGCDCDHEEPQVQRSALAVQRDGGRPTLRRGSTGPQVTELQELLTSLGFSPGRADGDFGRRTHEAVKGFQRSQGLGADGIVGPRTWGALGAPAAAPTPATGGAAGGAAPGTAGSGTSTAAGGGTGGGEAPASGEACPQATVPPDRSNVAVTSVGGIRVATSLAPSLERLLAAAAADGLQLSGGGFRSYESQLRLRRSHCGPTCFDIYQKPSRDCQPPTATPGRSQHEVGLAIDFRNTRTRSTESYQWLARRAGEFGLINLPSEPWHWSTTGR